MGFRRYVILSDPHSGHITGLTMQAWEGLPDEIDAQIAVKKRLKLKLLRKARIQAANQRLEFRERTKLLAEELQPVWAVLSPGDLTHGDDHRNGGIELLLPDRNDQVQNAAACLQLFKPKAPPSQRYAIARGTRYHGGERESWEDGVAAEVGGKVSDHPFIELSNGKVVDMKHKISNSTIPHGRFTPLAKTALWNLCWSQDGNQPKADIYIRGHVHWYEYLGNAHYYAMTCPACQGFTSFGARECEQEVNFGICWIDAYDDGHCEYGSDLWEFDSAKASTFRM